VKNLRLNRSLRTGNRKSTLTTKAFDDFWTWLTLVNDRRSVWRSDRVSDKFHAGNSLRSENRPVNQEAGEGVASCAIQNEDTIVFANARISYNP